MILCQIAPVASCMDRNPQLSSEDITNLPMRRPGPLDQDLAKRKSVVFNKDDDYKASTILVNPNIFSDS